MIAATVHQLWRDLPIGTLSDIVGEGSALILAPHPDDESLGCGGLISASVAAGRPPLVVILTDGSASHPNSASFPPDRLKAARALEARRAVARLGLPAERICFLGEPDADAPMSGIRFDAVVEALLTLLRREPACTAILAPWLHDPHCDHVAASLMAGVVARRAAVRHVAYPVWGWTLAPETSVPMEQDSFGWRLPIAEFLSRKRQAILAHATQYAGLIQDDPTGFQLPQALLSVFDSPYETFLQP